MKSVSFEEPLYTYSTYIVHSPLHLAEVEFEGTIQAKPPHLLLIKREKFYSLSKAVFKLASPVAHISPE